jgi:hypothetical protein
LLHQQYSEFNLNNILEMKRYSTILFVALLCFSASRSFGQAANLDQYRNGSASSPVVTGDNWVNGNAGASNSHYVEGMSIPYRCVMTGLPTGTPITITFGYDVRHNNHMAIDYLTHYDRLQPHTIFGHAAEPLNPVAGTGLSSLVFTTFTIPPAPVNMLIGFDLEPQTSYNALSAGEKLMTLYNGTITNIVYNLPYADLTAGQSEQQISITFTANGPTAVFAWGGHIGSRLDWEYDINGDPLSAGGISGSPYHMRLIGWTLNNLGNQDRSLSAAAVVGPPSCDVAVTPVSQEVCEGDNFSITLTTSGGTPPYTYVWTGPNGYYDSVTTSNLTHVITINNALVANAGIYDLVITDAAAQMCIASANIAVNVAPQCSITQNTNNECTGSTNTFSGPAGMSSYSWQITGNGSIQGLSDQQTVTVLSGNTCGGAYTLTLSIDSVGGCETTCSQQFTVTDNTPPQINCPADVTLNGDNGSGQPCEDAFGGGPASIIISNPSGHRTPVGVDFRAPRNQNHPTDSLQWNNGIMNITQTEYFEGMGIPQRIILTGIQPTLQTGNTHTLMFRHEAVKAQSGDRHAFDFLMSYEQAVDAAGQIGNSNVNELQDLLNQVCNGQISANAAAACMNNTFSASVNVPDVMGNPPNHHGVSSVNNAISCFEGIYGNRTIEIVGNAAITSASLSFLGYTGGTSMDNYAWYMLTWTSSSSNIVIKMAAHAAVGFGSCGYGSCFGAGRINGGPYHFMLELLDGNSMGRRDNQAMVEVMDCNLDIPVSFGTPTASDNCTAVPDVDILSDTTYYDTPNSKKHCRRWVATDDCNNDAECEQCIRVVCSSSRGVAEVTNDVTGLVSYAAYPNPFNSNVTIEFTSQVDAHSKVEVFTANGSRVATLWDGATEAGVQYKSQFDAKNLENGVYLYRITNGSNVINGKLTLIK